jgi:hypothetical protein
MTSTPTPRQREREARYSGTLSREFWGDLNELEDGTLMLYQLGCILQEVEARVLTAMKNARQLRATAKGRR